MFVLVLGLFIFLGVHSIRIVADGWRNRLVTRYGLHAWKSIYSILAGLGFVLIVWGFGLARQHPVLLYTPPTWGAHLNVLLVLVALVFYFAGRVPPNHFKTLVGHPQVFAVIIWAASHLFVTGMLHDVVLFVPFLGWALADLVASRRRDRRDGTIYPPGTFKGDTIAVLIGVIIWALFAFWLHSWLIGVKPIM